MSFPWTYKFLLEGKHLFWHKKAFGYPGTKIFTYGLSVKLMSKLPLRLYHACMNKFYHLSISWLYLYIFLLMVLLFQIPSSCSLFEIPDVPPCYVRQCSLFAYLIHSSLHEICLGGLHLNSLYALSLHSTLCSSLGSFSSHVRQNKRTSTCNI